VSLGERSDRAAGLEFATVITVYGAPRSRAFRVIWMLEELELPYELVPKSSVEAQDPELLRLNPNGKLPTLVDGKTVLWESLAINLYLCEKYGGELWPVSVEDRGHALKWSLWAMSQLEGPADAASKARAALPPGWLDPALGILEGQLKSAPYLLGESFTVADLNVSTAFFRPPIARVDLEKFPAVQAWIARCAERAAFRRMEERAAP
jgi:glutathione S-transferase